MNTRRRQKNKTFSEKENSCSKIVILNELTHSPTSSQQVLSSHDTHSISSQINSNIKRKESIFSDIDEGSFIEFSKSSSKGLPNPSNDFLPQFYYTCTDNNETEYSTSSKTPRALVGFHKFINTIKNKNVCNAITEDSLSSHNIKEDKIFNESVIAGSKDILAMRSHKKEFRKVLNSTEYSFNQPNVHNLLEPNISTVRLNLYDAQTNKMTKDLCRLANESKDKDYIISSDDEIDNIDDKIKDRIANNSPQKQLSYQSNHSEKDYLLESLFTEDMSLLSSNINCKNKIKDQMKIKTGNNFKFLPSDKHQVTEFKSTDDVIYLSDDANERIARWVMNSPFKETSFGSSFSKNEHHSLHSQNKDLESNHSSTLEMNLALRLAGNEHLSKDSQATVFTLERVAASPTNINVIEYIQPFSNKSKNKNICKRVVSDVELNSSLITNDKSIFSYILESPKDTSSLHINEKSTNNYKANLSNQVYKCLSSESSTKNQSQSKNSLEEKNLISSPIIIYDSDSSHHEEIITENKSFGSSTDKFHPKVTHSPCSVSNSPDVIKIDLVQRKSDSHCVSNSNLIESSNSNKIISQTENSQISKNLFSVSKSYKQDRQTEKIFVDSFMNSRVTSFKNISNVEGCDFALKKLPNKKLVNSVSSNESLHLQLTFEESDKNTELSSRKASLSSHSERVSNVDSQIKLISKRNSILKSKSSSYLPSLNLQSQIDFSSEESHSDNCNMIKTKSLTKSQSMKQIVCTSNDSDEENGIQKLRKEFNKLYNDSWKENNKQLSKNTLASQSSTNKARAKLQLEKKYSISQLDLVESSTSEDNFESYSNSTRQKKTRLKQNIYKKFSDSDESFIVSDSDIKNISSSPLLKKIDFSKRHINKKTKSKSIHKCRNNKKIIYSSSSDSENEDLKISHKTRTKTTLHQGTKCQIIERIIISSSSSDSEDQNYPNVFNKTHKFLKPKKKLTSITKSQRSESDKLIMSKESSETVSFLTSLTVDTPPNKVHKDAIPFLKHFKKNKDALTQKLYIYFNENVFNNQLPPSMKITWNSRMTKTAGFCYHQIDKSKPSGRGARIELSTKVNANSFLLTNFN